MVGMNTQLLLIFFRRGGDIDYGWNSHNYSRRQGKLGNLPENSTRHSDSFVRRLCPPYSSSWSFYSIDGDNGRPYRGNFDVCGGGDSYDHTCAGGEILGRCVASGQH